MNALHLLWPEGTAVQRPKAFGRSGLAGAVMQHWGLQPIQVPPPGYRFVIGSSHDASVAPSEGFVINGVDSYLQEAARQSSP